MGPKFPGETKPKRKRRPVVMGFEGMNKGFARSVRKSLDSQFGLGEIETRSWKEVNDLKKKAQAA